MNCAACGEPLYLTDRCWRCSAEKQHNGALGRQTGPSAAEYVGGFRDGERTDLLQGSPLLVARMRGDLLVYDAYQLVQTAAGFIYRHEGETDCEDE